MLLSGVSRANNSMHGVAGDAKRGSAFSGENGGRMFALARCSYWCGPGNQLCMSKLKVLQMGA